MKIARRLGKKQIKSGYNTKYAETHGCAEVSWETASICYEISRHKIERSIRSKRGRPAHAVKGRQ